MSEQKKKCVHFAPEPSKSMDLKGLPISPYLKKALQDEHMIENLEKFVQREIRKMQEEKEIEDTFAEYLKELESSERPKKRKILPYFKGLPSSLYLRKAVQDKYFARKLELFVQLEIEKMVEEKAIEDQFTEYFKELNKGVETPIHYKKSKKRKINV